MQNVNDISNDVFTLGTCFSPFVCINCAHFRFALTDGNLTAQSWSTGSKRRIGGGIQSSSCPAAREPQRACSQTKNSQIQSNLLWNLRIEYWGLFLERLGNLSDLKSCWKVAQFLAHGLGGFASLSDNFIISFSKLFKLLSWMQTRQT